VAVAALLAACGSESSSDSNETAGTYRLDVTEASFPTKQQLGETSLLKLGVRNSGKKTVPSLTVTITIAEADRPVWVLAQGYPKFAGSTEPGGTSTSNRKTFALGELKPGETAAAVWKVSAVKAGRYTVLYRVGAGLSAEVRAVTGKDDVAPGGSFVTEISRETPAVEVTDSGEVVEIKKNKGG
jgi:hypothetical protein